MAPSLLSVITTIRSGSFKTGGVASKTNTDTRPSARSPNEFSATHSTSVGPGGKTEPDLGLQRTVGLGSLPPNGNTTNSTTAPARDVASTTTGSGTSSTSGCASSLTSR